MDASLQTPDHGDLDITSVTVPTRGTAAPARIEEALVYVPDRGWGGRELVTYRVTDGDHTVRGTFRIRTVNDPPVANDETRPPRSARRSPSTCSPTTPTPTATRSPSSHTSSSPRTAPSRGRSASPACSRTRATRASSPTPRIAAGKDVDTVSYVVDDGAAPVDGHAPVTSTTAPTGHRRRRRLTRDHQPRTPPSTSSVAGIDPTPTATPSPSPAPTDGPTDGTVTCAPGGTCTYTPDGQLGRRRHRHATRVTTATAAPTPAPYTSPCTAGQRRARSRR